MDIFKILTNLNDLSLDNETIDIVVVSKLIEHYKIKNIRKKKTRTPKPVQTANNVTIS